jgi:hypothetical protein
MLVNANRPEIWKSDIAKSVDFYNNWFMRFAPKAYRDTRVETTDQVMSALEWTSNLTHIEPEILKQRPSVLYILRMATAPPIARDRLIGLAGISRNLVESMETKKRIPPRIESKKADAELRKIGRVIMKLIDKDLFPWLNDNINPTQQEIYRAATIVADRLYGAVADPIIRNAQEQRQLATIKEWLQARGYRRIESRSGMKFYEMDRGTFMFRLSVPAKHEGQDRQVNIAIDVVVMPSESDPGEFPLLIEAKSAGDFTNVNKRRKEEAAKIAQLKRTYGDGVRFILFLCGYFDSGYLGYEAAEGIDWLWEHRIDDLAKFGV